MSAESHGRPAGPIRHYPEMEDERFGVPAATRLKGWVKVEDIRKIALEPQDILVVSTLHHMKPEQREYLQRVLRECFGPDRKVIVLEAGLTLSVVDPKDIK